MKKKQKNYRNKSIFFGVIALTIFSSLMIISAEMGTDAGNNSYILNIALKQFIFTLAGFICYGFFSRVRILKFSLPIYFIFYFVILIMLLACRAFGEINGAYAWIWIGDFATIQPSEFAKIFMMMFAYKIFWVDRKSANDTGMKIYLVAMALYVLVVLLYQKDLGSAVVLFVISYCVVLLPSYKELKRYQSTMIILILVGLVFAGIALSPWMTNILTEHKDNYMIARFLAAANPFMYRYDLGYHIIMSLVSLASGGWTGTGYGLSIHKYMNFPNPSNDFILPVIVEELGVFGFLLLIILYCFILIPIMRYAIKKNLVQAKMIFLGTFLYFTCHFILNVGGVSGLIPLTGVPLLMVSSGGSSLVAALSAVGICQNEIQHIKELSNKPVEENVRKTEYIIN